MCCAVLCFALLCIHVFKANLIFLFFLFFLTNLSVGKAGVERENKRVTRNEERGRKENEASKAKKTPRLKIVCFPTSHLSMPVALTSFH